MRSGFLGVLPLRVGALVLAGAAALAVAAGPVRAQLLNNPGGESLPVEIQASSGIEWQQEAQVYIARGNATAKRGNAELHADTIIAHYRQIKGATAAANASTALAGTGTGNTEIFRVEAEGHVVVKRDTQNVVGDKAVYDVDQSVVVMTGKNLKLTTASDTVTARDSLEWYEQKQIAVARGDAVAIRTGKTVKGDVITAYMVKSGSAGAQGAAAAKSNPAASAGTSVSGKPTQVAAKPAAGTAKRATPANAAGKTGMPGGEESKINRVDAQGHVVITNGTDTGRGDFGVYNAASGIATLVGNVALARGNDIIRGQSAVMDLNNNISRMLPSAPGANAAAAPTQRVQGLFVRQDAAAARGGAKPAAAAGGKSP